MSVRIINGKQGFSLKVNGQFIKNDFCGEIKAITPNYIGVPYGSSEWISVEAIRRFWNSNRAAIIEATKSPYFSHWGRLIPAHCNPN